MVGVNNRDLKVMKTNLNHCIELRTRVPSHVLFVGESGIHTRADVDQLMAGGVHAMQVGETLMKSPDIGSKVRTLLGLVIDPVVPSKLSLRQARIRDELRGMPKIQELRLQQSFLMTQELGNFCLANGLREEHNHVRMRPRRWIPWGLMNDFDGP